MPEAEKGGAFFSDSGCNFEEADRCVVIACAFAGNRIGADRAFFPEQGSRILQPEQVIRRGKKAVAKLGQDCVQRLFGGRQERRDRSEVLPEVCQKRFGLVIENCRQSLKKV